MSKKIWTRVGPTVSGERECSAGMACIFTDDTNVEVYVRPESECGGWLLDSSMPVDEKCKSAIPPATESGVECELVTLDTDCDEWHTFVFNRPEKQFDETYPLECTKVKSEPEAQKLVLKNALILRGEPVSGENLLKAVESYLPELRWIPGFDRRRLSIEMS